MSEISGRAQVLGGVLGAVGGTAVALAAGLQARALAHALGLAPTGLVPGGLDPGGSAPVSAPVAPTLLGDAVGLGVLALGAVVAAWFALTGCGVLLCLALRAAGRRWTRGEAAVRTAGAPLVRRLVGVAAGAALGTSLAFSGAIAAPGDVPDDLGWAPPTAAPATTPDSSNQDSSNPGSSNPDGSNPVLAERAATVDPAVTVDPAATVDPVVTVDPAVTVDPVVTVEPVVTEPAVTVEPAVSEVAVRDPAGPSAAATTGGTPTHVVRPGESLWSIAAQALASAGRDASAPSVAAAWPAWYRANEAVIGSDPDLIRPGQVLSTPQR